jgi:Glycosyl hydrolase family 59/Galactocerebrosidase, C-terminal lectin domain
MINDLNQNHTRDTKLNLHKNEFVIKLFQNRKLSVLISVIVGVIGIALLGAAFAGTGTSIVIDGTQAGPTFQGVGAISGGGGNSRLLIDYPEPQRSQILNYMFSVGYGATIELLKLEIGGDANSTDGAEPSVEHTPGTIKCNSGYEWWLAQQALSRNPRIKLYGLQWTAPGWTGQSGKIWTTANVQYVIDWLNCAKSHNLPISYIGGWNEKSYDAIWYENMRAALDKNGYSNVKLIADDNNDSGRWGIANALASDPTFNAAINTVGTHDVCQYPTTGYTCTITQTALQLNKPLWMSEVGAMDANLNADAMVRSINNGYNQAHLTGFLLWPLLDSMPAGLPHELFGTITADQPWSGNYTVNKMTWAIAQTTHFVGQGWVHIGGADGSLGNSGTYTTYQTPSHSKWTMVAENTGTYAGQTLTPQNINVTVKGGLSAAAVHVWATDLTSSDPSQWFMHLPDVLAPNGVFSYTIPAGYVVTFTTNSDGQQKGDAGATPAATPLSLPYNNSLSIDDGSDEPALLAPENGSFGIVSCLGGRTGNCTEQLTPAQPVTWVHESTGTGFPYATIGDGTWSNYTVSSDMLFTQLNGSGGLIGRFSNRGSGGLTGTGRFAGYLFHIDESGNWQLINNSNTSTAPVILLSGTTKILGTYRWHKVALSMIGKNISVLLDGTTLGSVIDGLHSSGSAGIEAGAFTTTWPVNQYQNLSVTP